MRVSNAVLSLLLATVALPLGAHGEPISLTDTNPWKKNRFGNPKIEYLDLSQSYAGAEPSLFTHEMDLTIVLFRKSGWKIDQIQARLELLTKVYSQCGVKISKAKLVQANAPHGWIDMDGCHYFEGNRTFKLAALTPPTEKPVLYYVRSTTDESPACAGPLFNVGEDSPMLNTAWMTTLLNEDPTQPWNFPQFSDEAHELGHVLLNMSHVFKGPPNIMAGDAKIMSLDLTPSQCETMRKNELVRKIEP